MNRERLEIQVDILRNIKPEKFHMGSWMQSLGSACGTTCCAFGYAALDKRMQEQGLIMKVAFYEETNVRNEIRTVDEYNSLVAKKAMQGIGFRAAIPCFNGRSDYFAASAFYDITFDEAQYLFNPDRYIGYSRSHYLGRPRRKLRLNQIEPQDVIDRIEHLLAKEQVGFV